MILDDGGDATRHGPVLCQLEVAVSELSAKARARYAAVLERLGRRRATSPSRTCSPSLATLAWADT